MSTSEVRQTSNNGATNGQARHSLSGSTSARTGSDSMNWRSNAGNQPTAKKPLKSANQRSSTSSGQARGADAQNKRRTNSTNAVARILSENQPKNSSVSEISNGSAADFDCESDPFDLDEPFSDSDNEESSSRRVQRPRLNLPLPRGRIRTLSGTVPPVGYAPVFGGATMCLQCMQFFDLPKQTSEYMQHLIEEHKIVITDIELIVDLKRYVEHWRQRLSKCKIEEIFPKIVPDEEDALHGKVDFYHMMSGRLHEDKKLREKLAMRRLEEVLSCQQRERQDGLFTQQCLFCRYVARGNRSKLIHHLYMIHHLNLGSPDNLVFVAEYLDLLRDKITRFECIYCEKTFGDHAQLMEHMRKRGHREVNPKNNYYDKFYIINYLELGKKWLDVLAEDFEDQTPHFADSDEEEEERDGWAEWTTDNCDVCDTMCVCLLCDSAKEDIDTLLLHMKNDHGYDMVETMRREKMGFYDRVKFINYVRKACHTCVCWACGRDDLHSWQALRKHMADDGHASKTMPGRELWCKDEHLLPMFDNDNMLWLLESHLESNTLCAIDEDGDEPILDVERRQRALSLADADKCSAECETASTRPPVTAVPIMNKLDSELAKHPELLESLLK